jgi:O-antigen ligase
VIQPLARQFDPRGMPDFGRSLLLLAMAICGLVTLPQAVQIPIGPVSGLAMASMAICAAAWMLWGTKPWYPLEQWPILLPLALFSVFCIGSLLWYAPAMKGLQLLAVMAAFVGILLVTAREVERSPGIVVTLYRVLDGGILFSSAVYLSSIPTHGLGNEDFIHARSYALFALFSVARHLAAWRCGKPSAFWIAAAITAVIVLSVSRTAMIAAMLMFPLAALSRFDHKGVVQAAIMVMGGAAVLAAVILSSPMMYERFFGLDASMNVGGVAINGSGRSEMWALVYADSARARWLGQGVGSSAILIDNHFSGLGHPHNDFLRVLYDFGVLGLICFLWFLSGATWTLLVGVWRQAHMGAAGRVRLQYFLTPALSMVGIGAGMFTDNSVSYVFVMVPFGILLGSAMGLLPAAETRAARCPRKAGRAFILGNSPSPPLTDGPSRRAQMGRRLDRNGANPTSPLRDMHDSRSGNSRATWVTPNREGMRE